MKRTLLRNFRTRIAPVLCIAELLAIVPPARVLAAIPAAANEQLEAEQHAVQLVARPDIQAALGPLESAWLGGTPGILPETVGQLHASIEEVVFMVALEAIDGDARWPHVIEISAGPHSWFGHAIPGGRWGINNPDTLYFTVPVEAGSSYTIIGHRRSPGPTDSNFTLQTPDVWGAVGNIGGQDLQIDADGTYRITIDAEPPNGRPNHLQIKGGATALLIRNTLLDWSRELPDSITVHRDAGPAAAVLPTDDELARAVIARMKRVIAHSVDDLQPRILRLPANTIPQPGKPADKPGFLVTQRNTLGHFRLADDEALVSTFDPGGAGYATFPVTNMWGIAPDSRTHQNSLNTHQAVRNADGTITVVVSNRDPGVANWIDAAGLHEGIVMLRWQLLAKQESASEGPAVLATRIVKLDALAEALPAGTRLMSPAERMSQISQRGRDFERRFVDRFR